MDNIEILMLSLDDLDVDILTIADQNYPALLRQVKNPPPIIYLYCQIQKQDKKSIAILGSRNATEKGLQIVRGFGKRLGERGYTPSLVVMQKDLILKFISVHWKGTIVQFWY